MLQPVKKPDIQNLDDENETEVKKSATTKPFCTRL